jgi:hypothetical protein
MLLPFASETDRDNVFADLAASDKPRRAIAFYGLAFFLLIVFLSLSWLWLSQYLSASHGVELRSTLSASSTGGVSLPNIPGLVAGFLWLVVWLVGMGQIRKLALYIGKTSERVT